MSNFELAIPLILKHERGLVDNVRDPGGITNEGISLRYLKDLVKNQLEIIPELDINHNQQIDAPDIQALTLEEAKELYRKYWWEKYRFGEITHQTVANKVFDLAVNIGPKMAVKLLQEAYCKVQHSMMLVIDGVLGPNTLGKVNHLQDDQISVLLNEYCELAANYYRKLVELHPSLKKFLNGWIKRAYDNG